MTSTAVLTEDSATIVAEEGGRFSWAITLAGAVAATATTFFLLTLGAGIGLGFLNLPVTAKGATTFLTLGAIYFLAAQAFGFAVGGYLVGRLIGPEAENAKEEEFRAAAHGFAMWAAAVVASTILVGVSSTLAGSAIAAGAASRSDNKAASQSYWVDEMFRPALYSEQVIADKAEAGRILAMTAGDLSGADADRIARLVARDAGVSVEAGYNRVQRTEAEMRTAADNARKAASILALWTAVALLFGAAVSVAAAISARWMDDRISFSMAPRH
ncbi:MAG: hypothetical protein JO256_11395 [Alphaproteobacteria bacterium]|nr:hypothetical protein [Alphaproteobacteria bacterium]